MEVDKAIFTMSSKKPHFFISAFRQKLIFGPLFGEPQSYIKFKCFEIDYSDYHKIYTGFFPILKFLAGKTNTDEGCFLENCHYKWKSNCDSTLQEIVLSIWTENSEAFSINFTLYEFNDLVYLITELCFPSLGFPFETLTVFITLSKFELEKILSFMNKSSKICVDRNTCIDLFEKF